ncbi:hypothetical protein SNEBB_006044 [Seison nebaliae]|nr:hypothetical protein SNEBB_006044 [Seison nebaliae]
MLKNLLNKLHRKNVLIQTISRTLFIQTQETPNPNSLKFLPNRSVLPDEFGATKDFQNARDASQSPLAEKIFELEGVKSVFFANDFITVTKDDDDIDWKIMKPLVYGILMDFFSSNEIVINKREVDSESDVQIEKVDLSEEDEEICKMIIELLDTRIRPTVQEDGGDIRFIGYEHGVVKLKLEGACSTCPSSMVTLKRGIQSMLQFYIPEVQGVMQVEDSDDDVNLKYFEEMEKKLREERSKDNNDLQ